MSAGTRRGSIRGRAGTPPPPDPASPATVVQRRSQVKYCSASDPSGTTTPGRGTRELIGAWRAEPSGAGGRSAMTLAGCVSTRKSRASWPWREASSVRRTALNGAPRCISPWTCRITEIRERDQPVAVACAGAFSSHTSAASAGDPRGPSDRAPAPRTAVRGLRTSAELRYPRGCGQRHPPRERYPTGPHCQRTVLRCHNPFSQPAPPPHAGHETVRHRCHNPFSRHHPPPHVGHETVRHRASQPVLAASTRRLTQDMRPYDTRSHNPFSRPHPPTHAAMRPYDTRFTTRSRGRHPPPHAGCETAPN